jgi:RNA processing factor Prp31
MKMKSIKVALTLITSLALLSIGGVACVGELNAQTNEDAGDEYPLLVERFAEKFDLDREEVMDFLDELKDERKTDAQERFEERLDELVEDEKITEDQKEAILDKKEEMQTFKEELEDMTISEAREAIKDMHEELKDWAEDNDLDLKNFFPKKGAHSFGLRSFNKHKSFFKK